MDNEQNAQNKIEKVQTNSELAKKVKQKFTVKF